MEMVLLITVRETVSLLLRTHIRQERSEYTSFSMLEKAETETTHGACFGFFVTYFRRDEVKRAGVRCNKETASRTVIKSTISI